MDTVETFRSLALSVLLGLLVGLQRERKETSFAGIRTFPLVTVLGTLTAVLARSYGLFWMVPAGFLGVLVLVVIGSIPKLRGEPPRGGITTGVAMMLMYVVGALVAYGPWAVPAAVAGGVAILLYLKPQIHGAVARLGEEDIHAIMRFVLITFIVLPILPNTVYDPAVFLQPFFPQKTFPSLAVVNPFEIWLIVVLVVGISLGGYIGYKYFGQRHGLLAESLLGGMVSSTAVTLSCARRSVRNAAETAWTPAWAITVAGAVAYVRVLVEISIAGPQLLPVTTLPLLGLLFIAGLTAAVIWRKIPAEPYPHIDQTNPTELRTALLFAGVYLVILLALAAGKELLHADAIYAVVFISGLMNVDAVTLSTARLTESGRLSAELGRNLIVVGLLSNLLFKTALVALWGHRTLLKQTALLLLPQIAAALALLLLMG